MVLVRILKEKLTKTQWERNTLFCCTTGVNYGPLVVIFYHVDMNCDRKNIFFKEELKANKYNIYAMFLKC